MRCTVPTRAGGVTNEICWTDDQQTMRSSHGQATQCTTAPATARRTVLMTRSGLLIRQVTRRGCLVTASLSQQSTLPVDWQGG